MMTRIEKVRITAALCTVAGLAASAAAQMTLPEIEPNETKADAVFNGAFALDAGDSITGMTTGSTSTPNNPGEHNSRDYFLLQTKPATVGIYRHEMRLSVPSGLPLHGTVNIRGLSQSTAGVINPTSDFTLQSASLLSGQRISAWYGFGREERVFYNVQGTTSTTGEYVATLSTQQIFPADIGMFQEGTIEFTAHPLTAATPTAMWLYDANLNIIPDHGNVGASTGDPAWTRLVRNLNAGTYYLALSHRSLNVPVPSAPDDAIRNTSVTDFPDVVLSSSSTRNQGVGFSIIDQYGPSSFQPFKTDFYEIIWYKFEVGQIPASQTGGCCLPDSTCVIATASTCAGQGGAYQGDGSNCSVTCPVTLGACCLNSAPTCVLLTQSDCGAISGGSFQGENTTCPSVSCLNLPITPIPVFTGDEEENFNAKSIVNGCVSDGILAGNGVLCGSSSILASGGWSFACQINAQRGNRFIGASGGFIKITLDQPAKRFGGYFGSNAAATRAPYAEFYDQASNLIGIARIENLYGTCTWHWAGWEFDVPVHEIHLKNDAHGGAFLMVDYITVDWLGGACYANCDGSTTAPILNVEDFTCFINEFAAASQLPHQQQLTHYANCDQSTTAPVLNVEDFTCFINKFAQGCP
jgi:hypothetical protein